MTSIRARLLKPFVRWSSARMLRPDLSFAEQRAKLDKLANLMSPPGGIELRQEMLGELPLEWITPVIKTDSGEADEASNGAVLYLHGGGYTIGSPANYRGVTGAYAKAFGLPVLAPDYRLAPEHPFPAALDDALAAWQHLLASGYRPEQIVLAGDSAGAGLATALLLQLRDASKPQPAATILISPLLDQTYQGDSLKTKAKLDPVLNLAWLKKSTAAYCADTAPGDPYCSPVNCEPTALNPILIQVGSDEILLDDALRFDRRARRAGVDVQLDVWDNMWHDWHAYAALLPEGAQAIKDGVRWAREHLPA